MNLKCGIVPVPANRHTPTRQVIHQRQAHYPIYHQQLCPQDPVVEVITPYVYDNYGEDGSRGPFNGIWSCTLRVKITGRGGLEKLDVRIPAGFLEGMANIIPGLGGVNLKAMLDDAAQEVDDNLERGKRLIDINDRVGDRIQVFLE